MATLDELVVKIRADTAGFATEIKNAENSIRGVGDETVGMEKKSSSSLKNLIPSWQAIGAAVAAAGVALGAAGLKIISVAADADATTAKFNTVFKEYAVGTQQWADTYSAAAGRSRTDVMAWAASIQDTLVPMGYSREEAAKMSEQLVQTGVDLGSFYDQADSDVMDKLTSGLVGNTENWREWGVVASESAIKQELINMLGADGAKLATEQQKVQARLNILLKGTADAQGQAAREADSYQSQIKKLGGQIKDMMGEAGKPAMEKMAGVLKRVTDMLERGGSDRLVEIFTMLADAVAWAADQVLNIVDAFEEWGDSGLFETVEDFVDTVMENFVESFDDAYQAVQDFVGRGGLERAGQVIQIVIEGFTRFSRLLADLGVYKAFGDVVGFIIRGLLGFVDLVSYTIIAMDDFRKSIMSTLADVLDALGVVVPGASDMADGIREELERVPEEAETALSGLPESITGIIGEASAGAVVAVDGSVSDIANGYSELPVLVSGELSGMSGVVSESIELSSKDAVDAASDSVENIVNEYGKIKTLVPLGLDGFPAILAGEIKEADVAATQAAEDAVLHIGQPYETLPGQASRNIASLPAEVEHVVKVMDANATSASKDAANHITTPLGELPGRAGVLIGKFPAEVVGPINTASAQGNTAASKMVGNISTPIGTLPGKVSAQLGVFPQSVVGPVKTADTQASSASGALVNNAVQKFVPLPSRAGAAVSPIGSAITAPINSASTSSQASAGSMVSGIISRITPLIAHASSVFNSVRNTITSVMSGAISSVSALGGSMYSAAASMVQRAIDGLNSKLASLRSTYNTIMSYVSGGSSASISRPGSGAGGGSGGGTGSATITSLPTIGGGSRPISGTPTTIGYNPLTRNVTVNINNKAADVNSAAKTTAKVVKASVKVRSV